MVLNSSHLPHGKMKRCWVVLLLLVVVQATTRQAPGDEDSLCVTLASGVTVNRHVLMGSFNYNNLLGSNSPWISVDGNVNPGEMESPTWSQSGQSCERVPVACMPGEQNDWLITQFINNTLRRNDIYVTVRYSINSVLCTGGCLTTLDMYVLQTSESNQSFTRNLSVFGTTPVAALTDLIRDGTTLVSVTRRITVDLSTAGLYVAFRDQGTCIGLSEVTVFYPVCDAVSFDFGANFSETQFSGGSSMGQCFTNMAINVDSPNASFEATCIVDLVSDAELLVNWTIMDGPSSCMCLPGYNFVGGRSANTRCEACPPFTFKSTLSNEEVCQPCPLLSNTTATDMATPVCPCDPGYFRTIDEAALPCTRPPSAPANLMITSLATNISVSLGWDASTDDGDRTDLFYTISQNVTDTIYTTQDTSIMLTDLIPFVYYELRVTADNGVSSQVDSIVNRTLTVFARTLEGVGGNISQSSISDLNNVLTWDRPLFPQGTILFYEVTINGTIRGMPTATRFDASAQGAGNHIAQIRAVTAVGPGLYSDPYTFRVVPNGGGGGDDGNSLGLIIGVVVGVIVVIIIVVLAIIIIFIVCKKRTGKHEVKDMMMTYGVQNDEDIVKKLPGIRKYVDPQNYASPETALKDFADEIPSHQLRLDEVIGGGEFGDVCRGIWYKPTSKHLSVAIKTLKPGSPYKDRVDFLTEASIMGQFHHANVIELYGVVTKTQPVMIVMEYMENKSLDVYLRQNDDLLGPERLVAMAKGVASGMQYFSEIGFVHRDLAARNVLVSKEEVCKIADFGLSRETNVENAYDVKTGGKIPIRWTAPEAIQYRKFTTSSDVWSFGVLLWEVMTYGQQPYWDWSNHKVLDEVEAGYRLEIPKDCPKSVYEAMLDCWNIDHRLRPRFDEIGKELDTLLQNNFQSTRQSNAAGGNSTDPLDFDSVEVWLRAIKMDRYIETFQQSNLLQPRDCLGLTSTSLIEMGITLSGHQHKILSSIQAANSRLQREPSYKI